MVAANAQIGEAKAAFFPSISLTGLFGAESASLSNLFTTPSTIWQISGSVGQLLYDGGRASSNLRILEARKKEALIQYEIAVRNAFQDILNALVAQRKAHEALDANMKRTEALEVALKLAEARYQNGVASQLDLLDAERGLLDAELSRIEAQRIQLAGSADLFKALGGGWNSTSDPSGVRQPDRR
jgi:multidrug efflux system outer membrane protein